MQKEEYREDAMGRLVHISKIKEIDLLRDELVTEKISKMERVSLELSKLKSELVSDIYSFVQLSAEKYNVKIGGKGGNITLQTFDGSSRIQLTIAKKLEFDERLQAAKALVDSCIVEWSKGSNSNLNILVTDAFAIDKKGCIDTQRILSLTKVDINDKNWKLAMKAIKDSLTVNSTTTYVRGYVRDIYSATNELKAINLNLSRA